MTTDLALLRVLRGERLATPPVWLMRQAGRYLPEYRATRAQAQDFLNLCYTPDLAVEVTLQPIRRFGFDASILFSDILVVPHALGQGVRFEEGRGPVLDALTDGAAVAALDPDRAVPNLGPVFETVSRLRAELPPHVTLIGFAGAPWTVASYMIEGGTSKDHAKVRLFSYRHPEAFQALIDVLVEATVQYLDAQVKAGAQVLQLFDSWAGVLPEAGFHKWVVAPNKAIVGRLKALHPDVPIIGFPRGAGVLYGAYVARTGVDAVSLDTAVPLGWAGAELQTRVPVQGNLDPMALVAGGAALEAAVAAIRHAFAAGPHVFNLGHGIVPETPPEHVSRLIELIRTPL